jgi:hypothetical protein
MGAVTLSLPAKYFCDDETAIPASRTFSVPTCISDAAKNVEIVTFELVECEPKAKHVVKMRPMTFAQIADHFSKVHTPIDWPLDEEDIE